MQYFLFVFVAFIFCDNFILTKNDFDLLYVDEHVISSKYLAKDMALQISFPGVYVYKLEYENGNVRFIDKTVYLKRKNTKKMYVYLSVHTKKYGLFAETWILIATLCGLFVFVFAPVYFLMLVNKKHVQ